MTGATDGSRPTNLAGRLRRYVSGSLAGLFSGQTNVALDNNLVVFDLKGLDGELRTIALMLVDGKRMHVRFVASPLEHKLATTDPVELAQCEEVKSSELSQTSHKELLVEAGETDHD